MERVPFSGGDACFKSGLVVNISTERRSFIFGRILQWFWKAPYRDWVEKYGFMTIMSEFSLHGRKEIFRKTSAKRTRR